MVLDEQSEAPPTVPSDPADHSAVLREALGYAVMAPSTHNSQPWRFRVAPDHVDLCADRTRSLPVADPDDRELTISCGASLFFLRTALRQLGWDEETALLPDPNDEDALARVSLVRRLPPTPEIARLVAAFPVRRTVRTPFGDDEIDARLLADLQTAAAREGAVLQLIEGEGRRRAVALLVEDADRLQASDLAFRRELAQWVHPNRSVRRDGLPAAVFGLGDTLSYAGPTADRYPDRGPRRAGHDQQLTFGSPILAAVVTPGDSTRDWLNAGQALGRILLQAAASGVMASFLNQPIEVAKLRRSLARAIGTAGVPQLVLRMGYPSQSHGTPRRPVREVEFEQQGTQG